MSRPAGLQLIGVLLLAVAGALVALPLGLAVLGVAAVAFGIAAEVDESSDLPEWSDD